MHAQQSGKPNNWFKPLASLARDRVPRPLNQTLGNSMSFEHLQKNAERAFEDAKIYSESKPDVAEEAMADGHLLMAAYYLANADEAYVSEVASLIDIELKRFSKKPELAYVNRQNQYVLLCLSSRDHMRARKILSIPVKYKNCGAFDVQLNVRLRQTLGISEVSEQQTLKLTQSEADLINAFDAALKRSDVNWSAVASAWKSLRSKRFKLTVLEHRDLFTSALINMQE